jgi:hypothetical protein
MQANFEVARREQENAALRSEQEAQDAVIARQRQGFILGGILLLLSAALVLVLLRSRRESQRTNLLLSTSNSALEEKNEALNQALENVQTLRGLIPICANCKKVRDDHGFWEQVETYVSRRSEASFTHGICPDCVESLYPELQEDPETEEV